MGLERRFVYLTIPLDDVNGDALLIGKLGDPHCALVPPHDAAVVLECLDKQSSGGGCHLETFIFDELRASLVVNALTQLT